MIEEQLDIERRYQALLEFRRELVLRMQQSPSMPSEARFEELARIDSRLVQLSICRKVGYIPPYFEIDRGAA